MEEEYYAELIGKFYSIDGGEMNWTGPHGPVGTYPSLAEAIRAAEQVGSEYSTIRVTRLGTRETDPEVVYET